VGDDCNCSDAVSGSDEEAATVIDGVSDGGSWAALLWLVLSFVAIFPSVGSAVVGRTHRWLAADAGA
jgi:hypothetical protein